MILLVEIVLQNTWLCESILYQIWTIDEQLTYLKDIWSNSIESKQSACYSCPTNKSAKKCFAAVQGASMLAGKLEPSHVYPWSNRGPPEQVTQHVCETEWVEQKAERT